MPARVAYFTDPASPACWGAEPSIRRLVAEFGAELTWTFVMGGLHRDIKPSDHGTLALDWLESAAESRMPVDPLIWRVAPLKSNYPAAMAVKAAAEQASDGGALYLRLVREGIMCFRRKLDTVDALVEVARAAGLDAERFRLDLASNAIVEGFGNDLERARDVSSAERVESVGGPDRLPLPTLVIGDTTISGRAPYEEYRAAAIAAGAAASSEGPLPVDEALRRFGRLATREVEELCGLRGPRAEAELWRLALEFEVRPLRAGTGWLWEPAG
jgi:predicted DsbA family dithiol-disulfide isomerase